MAVTQGQIDKFVKHCVKKPNAKDVLKTDKLQGKWTPGFFEHTVKKNESLQSIAKYYSNAKKAPHGFDWKWLCRFNFGVDYPPYINYKLIDKFGLNILNEAELNKNRTKDHKNYSFKGGEKLKIPLREGASKPGSISPNRRNTIQRRTIKITSVQGPAFMTVDIASKFGVTGYSVDNRDVTKTKRDSIHWWINNITKNDDGDVEKVEDLSGEDSGEAGEKIKLTIAKAQVDSGDYRIGDWIRMYPYFDDKANINLLIYVQFRLIAVEFKHDIPRTEIGGGSIAANDDINKIHNPAVVIIGAKTDKTCAILKLTKVTSDEKKTDAGVAVIVDGKKVMIPAISPNDNGFIWKIKTIKGKATFVKIKMRPENKGSDCLVYGLEPGYVRIEGWCLEAEKYCVSKILKVVNEREIPYRVNLLTSKGGHTTNETVPSLQTVFKVQNIYLRPVGVKLVPDSNASDGVKLSDENIALAQVDVGGTMTNVPGYFNVTNVDNQYVRIGAAFADSLAASTINARANVVNYVMVRRIEDNTTLGMGPTAMRNLHTQPTEGRGAAVGGMLKTFTGPDEETVWIDAPKKFDDSDIDDVAKKDSLKKMEMFETPDSNPGHKNLGGIIIPHAASPGPVKTTAELTESGATYAHELGHVVGIRHRGGDPKPPNANEGEKPDLLPSSVTNIMYWTEDNAHSPADWDLIQTDVFRGCMLCSHDSNKGNLQIKAFTRRNAISGAHNSKKTFNLEVLRNRTKVAGAFLNFWIEGTRAAIEIEQVQNWTKTSRIMSTGLAKVKIKFTGTTGNVAKLIIMAGDNDDLVTLEITCTVTA